MSGWGCPHEVNGKCQRVNNIPCDLGMKGCVLFGRFRFADDTKNRTKRGPSIPATKASPSPDDVEQP